MIPPSLAAAAATTAIGALSSIASAVSGSSSSSSSSSSAGSTSSSSAAGAAGNDALGQQQFLQLLVAQLQNQDPLNPMDSAQFTAQLAQFSSLEQLTQINDKLSNLTQPATTPAQSFDPVGLLGRDVTASGSTVEVKNGTASQLEYTLTGTGRVSVEVRDASGNLISTAQLGELAAGDHTLDLHAVPAFANLPDGTYQVAVSAQSGNGTPTTVDTTISGTVTSVDLQSNPPVLKIGDISIPIGDVRDVSAAAAA